MSYEYTSRIRYSEVDQSERLSVDHLADYFQDATIFHDDEAGLGLAYWRERCAMWVTTYWKILMFEMPRCCERVTIRTDAISCRSFVGLRNFRLRGDDGRLMAAAFSKYALLDTRTGKPVRILPEEGAAYGTSDPLPMEDEKNRLVIPEDAVEMDPIIVERHHLDPNHHLNNVQFILIAMNYLPEGFTPRMMRVFYHRSAVLGDTLIPRFSFTEHEVLGALLRTDGEPYALFHFSDVLSEQDARIAEL